MIGNNDPQPGFQRLESTLSESNRLISGLSVEFKLMADLMQDSVSSCQRISVTTQTQGGSYPDIAYETEIRPILEGYCSKIEKWEHNARRLGLYDISSLSGLASPNIDEWREEAESIVLYLERYRNS
jgi:hypothetical protein